MGEGISNQSGRSDSFCGQRKGWLLSGLPLGVQTCFQKQSFLQIILTEALFVNLVSVVGSKTVQVPLSLPQGKASSESDRGWGGMGGGDMHGKICVSLWKILVSFFKKNKNKLSNSNNNSFPKGYYVPSTYTKFPLALRTIL